MLGRHYYSSKQLHKKNTSEVQDMLMELNVNWNDIYTWQKRGSCIVPSSRGWVIDKEIPILQKIGNI